MKKIYFWRDVLGNYEVFSPYQDKINALMKRDYSLLSLEKLRSASSMPIYSLRLNQANRLLFTNYQGKLCLLEIILNHDYQKSRFLRKPSVLRDFLANLNDEFIDLPPSELETVLSSHEPFSSLDVTPVDYYQNNFIQLSLLQQQALYTKLPAIIYGPAGAGKTCVAISMLLQFLRDYQQSEKFDLPVMYLTQSTYLVEEMKRNWLEMAIKPVTQKNVQFKTYAEIANELFSTTQCILVDDAKQFPLWYKQQGKLSYSMESLWHEFRICSGYETVKQYQCLGQRQCALDSSQREHVYRLYVAYREALASQQGVSPTLHRLPTRAIYSLIVVDEAQDLSYGQLASLSGLTNQQAIVYLLGDHQILFDGKSRLAFLRQFFYERGNKDIVSIQLPGSYRCSQSILNVANRLIKLKYQATGGTADQLESTIITAAESHSDVGEACWLKRDEIECIKEEAKHAYFAIVTLSEYLEEARELFKTPLVFTAEMIKGLEYETIGIWRPFDSNECKQACAKLPSIPDNEFHSRPHRAKPGQSDESFLPYFNRLITAVTRARRRLVFIQDASHAIEPIFQALHPLFVSKIDQLRSATLPSSISTVAWEEEARRLMDAGMEDHAKAIFTSKLDRSLEQFTLFSTFNAKLPTSFSFVHTQEKQEKKVKPGVAIETVTKSLLKPEVKSILDLLNKFTKNKLKKWLIARTNQKELEKFLFDLLIKREQTGLALSLMDHLVKDINKLALLIDVFIEEAPLLDVIPLKKWFHLLERNKKSSDTIRKELIELLIAKTIKCLHPTTTSRIDLFASLTKFAKPVYQLLNTSTRPLVCFAFFCARKDIIPKLIELGLNVNQRGKYGVTPAYLAAEMGYTDILVKLHEFGADLNLAVDVGDTGGETPAFIAAHQGHTDILIKLHEFGADIHKTTNNGTTPAYIAAQNGHIAALVKLHEFGADLNQATEEGTTPAYIAAQTGHNDVLVHLHRLGADLNQATKYVGITPAFAAAYEGHVDTLVKLYELDADLNKADDKGQTPAFAAAHQGHIDVLVQLHKLGANLNQAADQGETPALIAAYIGDADVLVKLYELGADLNQAMNNGATPAYIAAQNGHLHIIKILLNYNQSFNQPLIQKKTNWDLIMNDASPDIFSRFQQKIKERLAKGDNEAAIAFLPIDIAEIMGDEKVIALLNNPSFALSENGFFSSAGTVNKPLNSSFLINKNKLRSIVN